MHKPSLLILVLVFTSSFAFGAIPISESAATIPYDYKGSIEVADSPNSLAGTALYLASFGMLANPTVDSVKKRLEAKMAAKAKLYAPDAVVNVVYSPLADDPRFLTSRKVYAKGDMITYKKAYPY